MKKVLTVGLGILVFFSCSKDEEMIPEQAIWFNGVDLSFQLEIEPEGFSYKDADGNGVELLSHLKSSRFNLVRLRLWHDPENDQYDLYRVLDYAERASELGYGILLDFHYSDTWADPGQQDMPEAWQGLSFAELETKIYEYTKSTVQAFLERGIAIPVIQVGNETNQGFLWDTGKVDANTDEGWDRYRSLTSRAIAAVREVSEESLVMLHYAGISGANGYFSRLRSLDYDVIGLSFYSRWHKADWNNLQSEMDRLASIHDKKLIIVETSYPWTLGWSDFTNNIWGLEEHLLAGYPATPEGQRKFMVDLTEKIRRIPENRGIGFCYWAPDWVAYGGEEATNGSAWENAAMFDFDGNALPVLDVLKD